MTWDGGRLLVAASWALCTLAACAGQLIGGGATDGGGRAGDLAMGGGMMGACASGPAPTTAAEEVLADYPDGQRCVVLSCAELDPDQMGELGGLNAIEPGRPQAWYTLGMFGKGCEFGGALPPSCDPHAHGRHRGGNRRHNVCADVYGPYPNDYYTLPPRGTVLLGDGSDAVVNGYCLDGIHFVRDVHGMIIGYLLWEVKTARYGSSRTSGRPVCLFIKRKILANVVASILKEYPSVRMCGGIYQYELVVADKDLWSALYTLRERAATLIDNKENPATAAVNLMSWNLPVKVPDDITNGRAVSIASLLANDLHVPRADLAEAEAIVVEYLTGPPPYNVRPFTQSPACDNWEPGDPY